MSIYSDLVTLQLQITELNNIVQNLPTNSLTSYLPITGGTLQGPLYLNSTPTNVNQAANKAYVDDNINIVNNTINQINNLINQINGKLESFTGGYLSNLGGVIQGDLTILGDLNVNGTSSQIYSESMEIGDNNIILNSNFTSGEPFTDVNIIVNRGNQLPVSVQWDELSDSWKLTVDGINYYDVVTTEGNSTFFNPMFVSTNPVYPNQIANKLYIDTFVSSLQNSINNNLSYLNNNYYNQTDTNETFAALSGANFKGEVTVLTPTNSNDAATKNYVDLNIDSILNNLTSNYLTSLQTLSNYLSINGGSLNGPLNLNNNPTLPLQAATKNYVDTVALNLNTNILNTTSLVNYYDISELQNYVLQSINAITGTDLSQYVQTSTLNNYLTINNATSTYLTINNAEQNYVQNNSLNNTLNNYLTISEAEQSYIQNNGIAILNEVNTSSLILDGVNIIKPSSQSFIGPTNGQGTLIEKIEYYDSLNNNSLKTTTTIFNNYQNNSNNNQEILFPFEYNIEPTAINNINADITLNTTSLIINNSTSYYNGSIIILGI